MRTTIAHPPVHGVDADLTVPLQCMLPCEVQCLLCVWLTLLVCACVYVCV